MEIGEDVCICLKAYRERVRGINRWPGCEKPLKVHGSIKTLQYCVQCRAGEDRVGISPVWQDEIYLWYSLLNIYSPLLSSSPWSRYHHTTPVCSVHFHDPWISMCSLSRSDSLLSVYLNIPQTFFPLTKWVVHQQKTFPSGRYGSVKVDGLRQSRRRHPGGGSFRSQRQVHASRHIWPGDGHFAASSRSVSFLF